MPFRRRVTPHAWSRHYYDEPTNPRSAGTDHPAQQFTRGIQLLSAESDVQLTVYYWSVAKTFHDAGFDRMVSWDVDLLSGYTWAAPEPGQSAAARFRWYISQLHRMRPDVVLCYGWASPIARASLLYCALTRIRILLDGDSTWQHASRGRYRLLRSVAIRILSHVCTGAVSTGAFNREFYIRHGMRPHRIWPGVCPVDAESFVQARADVSEASSRGGPGLRIGFAWKLIARKGVDE